MLAQRLASSASKLPSAAKPTADFSARASGAPGLADVASVSISSTASAQQGGALLVVEDLEARRHAGLERKALQQALAEGVDGLHLEAARRLDGHGEQPARAQHLVGRRRAIEQLRERST